MSGILKPTQKGVVIPDGTQEAIANELGTESFHAWSPSIGAPEQTNVHSIIEDDNSMNRSRSGDFSKE